MEIDTQLQIQRQNQTGGHKCLGFFIIFINIFIIYHERNIVIRVFDMPFNDYFLNFVNCTRR